MLAIAFSMIILGLLCFIYASFGTGKPNSTAFRKNSQKNQNHSLQDRLFNVKYKKTKNPLIEKRVVEERNISEKVQKSSPEYSEDEEIVQDEFFQAETNPFTEPNTNTPKGEIEVEFTLEGILYLDKEQKIPFGIKNLKEKDLPENIFEKFHRLGPGLLCEDGEKLVFKVDNANYYYSVDELDQVVFFDQAIVLMPSNSNFATPVFFSEDVESFRKFLKERSEK